MSEDSRGESFCGGLGCPITLSLSRQPEKAEETPTRRGRRSGAQAKETPAGGKTKEKKDEEKAGETSTGKPQEKEEVGVRLTDSIKYWEFGSALDFSCVLVFVLSRKARRRWNPRSLAGVEDHPKLKPNQRQLKTQRDPSPRRLLTKVSLSCTTYC